MQALEPLSANARTPPGFTSTLVFSRDNPSCTVISELVPPMRPGYDSYDMNGYDDIKNGGSSLPTVRPLYSVNTNRTLDRTKARGGVNTITEIHTCSPLGGEGELVAVWEWKEYSSDIFAMRSRGMEKEPISNWLKKGFIAFSSSAKFKDHLGHTYKWDREGPREQHRLLALDISNTTVVAFFERSQPYITDTNPDPLPAMLHLTPRAEEIREDVVLSFLYMEKNRRIADHTLEMAAQSQAYGNAFSAVDGL